MGCRNCDSVFGKTSLPQSCRFHGCFSWSYQDFVTEFLPSLDGGKVLASQLFARKILPVLSDFVASSAREDQDSGEYNGHTHHILNKNCLFKEVEFFSTVGNFSTPGSDSG